MMNFRALLFLATTIGATCEILTLANEARFTGKLLSIDPNNGVLIQTARSSKPLGFKVDSFIQLDLEGPVENDPFQTERLILTNGDILPGNLVSMDANSIIYEGLARKSLAISREKVKTLRLGIRPQVLSYHGPGPLSEWDGLGAKNWFLSKNENEELLILESGRMEQDVQLGGQFILQFDLKWQERPSVRIYFCADTSQSSQQDRYYVDLNSGGLQIKREQSGSPRYDTLISLSQVEAFDDNEVNVELRVNRLIGTIDLYLDGELIRQMIDSFPPTSGDYIAIERSGNIDSASYLSNLKVFSWDAISQLELLEKQGQKESDSLVDYEGKRMSGQLLSLEEIPQTPQPPENAEPLAEPAEPKTPHFFIQSPYAEGPVKVPMEKARIVYFKQVGDEKQTSELPKYELDLANDGLISAKKLNLTRDQLLIQHPILGELTIERSTIRTIRYLSKPAALVEEDE